MRAGKRASPHTRASSLASTLSCDSGSEPTYAEMELLRASSLSCSSFFTLASSRRSAYGGMACNGGGLYVALRGADLRELRAGQWATATAGTAAAAAAREGGASGAVGGGGGSAQRTKLPRSGQRYGRRGKHACASVLSSSM